MRNTARCAAALGLAATAAFGPLTGAATAAPETSSLVLTARYGDTSVTLPTDPAAGWFSEATLTCSPSASGTHPNATSACAELRRVKGDLDALQPAPGVMCPMHFDPVVVTVNGVWEGRNVSYERTFGNTCVKNTYGSVFAF
ncbi:SSI family serine proteinase inhibitor [Streptomyces sp. NPDC007945]|uniref:SSI family serine proteinase inhibitor n=1 Tax=Streptomyces sp. NPDC007945 TaxID=3364797 RepID=UPI0036E71115